MSKYDAHGRCRARTESTPECPGGIRCFNTAAEGTLHLCLLHLVAHCEEGWARVSRSIGRREELEDALARTVAALQDEVGRERSVEELIVELSDACRESERERLLEENAGLRSETDALRALLRQPGSAEECRREDEELPERADVATLPSGTYALCRFFPVPDPVDEDAHGVYARWVPRERPYVVRRGRGPRPTAAGG